MRENDMLEKEEIFSKVLRAGRRTYFFDVRATKADDYYITITESKKFTEEDGSFHFKKHKIYLYKEDFTAFSEILLFDDCLSAVDTETEEAILNNLYQICKNKTTIIVSHRVSSAKNADKIIILEDGKIIEQGSHNQLINQEGYYAALYLKQLSEKELL